MREADRHTIEEIGIPSLVLMENAGRQVVAAIETAFDECLKGRVAVLCGRGNDASMTVTLAAPKLPLVLPPAEARAGDVVIADIGIPSDVIDALDGPYIELLTREDTRALIEPRSADSHKGDFGRVLVIAG